MISVFFFFNDTATTEIYTLSLHDALPISDVAGFRRWLGVHVLHHPARAERVDSSLRTGEKNRRAQLAQDRSEEHTSELQSRLHLVCRLLLEKKKQNHPTNASRTSPHHASH